MDKPPEIPDNLTRRVLQFASCILTGLVFSQILSFIAIFQVMSDPQAAGMVVASIIQKLSTFIILTAFVVLSLANLFVKRAINLYKTVRLPALILMSSTALISYVLIPRMDFLKETALVDGYPVALSPLANYFQILEFLLLALLTVQAISALLMSWRQVEFKPNSVNPK